MIAWATDHFRKGGLCSTVVQVLGEKYNKSTQINSKHSCYAQIRSSVIQDVSKNPLPTYDLNGLRAFQTEPSVALFLAMNLKQQYAVQRAFFREPGLCAFSEPAKAELAQLTIVPVEVHAFYMDRNDQLQLKMHRAERLLHQNASILHVVDGMTVLEQMTSALEKVQASDSYHALIVPLLLASGRRLTEICSGRSTFEPVEDNPHCALFSGQLKTKSDEAKKYRIPLLCDFRTFDRAYGVFKAKQSTSVYAKRLPLMQPVEIEKKYANQVRLGFLRTYVDKGILPKMKLHGLRSVYAAFCYDLFKWKGTFPHTCRLILGHISLAESLSYSCGKISGLETGTFGTIDLEQSEQSI